MIRIAAALALALAACTTSPDGAGPCTTERLAGLIGQQATEAHGAEAMRLSGARAMRWLRPNDVMTMDFRADRLNAHLDVSGRFERFACG